MLTSEWIKMLMSFSYQCYGWRCHSEIALPCLQAKAFEDFDVKIIRGNVPESLDKGETIGCGLQINSHCILLSIKDIARYCITKSTITVDPDAATDLASVQNFLVSAAFPYLGLLRKKQEKQEKQKKKEKSEKIILRGSAFTLDEKKAHLILGFSGTGKSSYLAGLCQQGAKFLSDQYVVISEKDNHIFEVEAGVAQIKLWKDAIIQLGITRDALTRVRPNIERYYWSNPNSFYADSLPVVSLFLLQAQNPHAKPLLAPITGIKKMQLAQFQLLNSLYENLGIQKQALRQLIALSNQCKLYTLQQSELCTIHTPINSMLNAIESTV